MVCRSHTTCLLQLYATNFWTLDAESVAAVCEFSVCLVCSVTPSAVWRLISALDKVSANSACLIGCLDALVGYFSAPAELALTGARRSSLQRVPGVEPCKTGLQREAVFACVSEALGKACHAACTGAISS